MKLFAACLGWVLSMHDVIYWFPANRKSPLTSAGLTKLELNNIKGPTAAQYDALLEALPDLQHLHIDKVLLDSLHAPSWVHPFGQQTTKTSKNMCLSP